VLKIRECSSPFYAFELPLTPTPTLGTTLDAVFFLLPDSFVLLSLQIQQCSAKLPPDENGLQEGMEWMVTQMSESGGGGGGGGDNTK
jgi:hypothetical protein